jgi:ribonuclease E
MSRQRLRESSVRWKISLTDDSFSLKLIKLIEEKSILNKAKISSIKICEKIGSFIKNNFNEEIKFFENKNKIKIDIIYDNKLIGHDYIIEFKNKSKKILEKIISVSEIKFKKVDENKKNKFIKPPFKKKKFNKKKFYKKKTK